MTTHTMEFRQESETPQLTVRTVVSASVPYEKAKKMTAEQRTKIMLGKDAVMHTVIADKEGTPIAYMAKRDKQLIELHIYPTNLSISKKAADGKNDREFNPGLCNWASYDKKTLELLCQIVGSLVDFQGKTIDFESDEAGTKYMWSEDNLRLAYKRTGLQKQIDDLNHNLMEMTWCISTWLYSVTQYASCYAHREILGRLVG